MGINTCSKACNSYIPLSRRGRFETRPFLTAACIRCLPVSPCLALPGKYLGSGLYVLHPAT